MSFSQRKCSWLKKPTIKKRFSFLFSHWFPAITFLFSIFADCVRDESCTEKIASISPKSQKFVVQTDFCLHRWRICNKRNSATISKSFYWQVNFRKRSSEKKIHKRSIYHYSAAVQSMILLFAYPEFTVHLQNLILWLRMTCYFSLMHVLQSGKFFFRK